MALAQPAPPAPADGVLLLRSGRVLAGKVRRDGTRYVVSLPAGEIRIRAEDVEHVSATLQGGYEYKRATILPGSAGPHLDLAAWCLAQGLWDEARRELDDARRLEPRHPKIPLLERRLTTDQRTASQPAAADAHATAAKPGDTPADDERDTAPDVPKPVVDAFAASVQPILQNHCSAAACHGPTTTSSFRLVRHPYGRPIARTTHENLRAVLELVDREHPSQSPLLMTPIKPHGRMREAVFKPRDTARYRQLVAWVQQVAGSTNLAGKPDPDQQPPLLQQAKEPQPPSDSQPKSLPANVKPAGFPMPPAEKDRSLPQGFVPRDAFDPEIFNRRYFPGRK
jgi:hypothetical protein